MKESDFQRIVSAVRELPDGVSGRLVQNLSLRDQPQILREALLKVLDKAHPSFSALLDSLQEVKNAEEPAFVAFMTALRYRSTGQTLKVTPICTLSTGTMPGFGRTREETLRIIDGAEKTIYVLGFWLTQNVDYIIRALERASSRSVKVFLLADSKENFLNPFLAEWDSNYPAPAIYLFRPSLSRNGGTDGAKMHAKTIIADDERMIVTSANLTHFALHENVELGVLIEGRSAVMPVSKMVNSLIHNQELFERVRT
jgi:phosphatidylserine/phosphatidylglycerophosphate/cardiolipin synthase-like enzyme